MKLFGYELKKKDKPNLQSFAPPADDAGVQTIVAAGGHFGHYVDMTGDATKSESELLLKYRQAAAQPECDSAISEIVNESISTDETGSPVALRINDITINEDVKKEIVVEFEKILSLLDFNANGLDIFRNWYIDGKLYYHLMIDMNDTEKGIQEIRYIDPLHIRKVREVSKEVDRETGAEIQDIVSEYFVYSPNYNGLRNSVETTSSGSMISGLKIKADSIVYTNSGVLDPTRSYYVSAIHKALKAMNQLRMLEDAMVIYRYSRAPERRIFYIDVGNLAKGKAEEHVRSVMSNYRNKMVYEIGTGEIRDDRKHMCLSMDTLVPLLDGRTLSLKQISDEYASGKKLWVYSCDPITGKFQPGLVDWAGVVKTNSDVLKITLDNGKTITCTPEHRFPVWNKGLVRSDMLSVGDSMIPHYTKTAKLGTKTNRYEQIFLNDEKRWEYTHRLVSKWKDNNGILNEYTYNPDYLASAKGAVHHKNINPFDISPENLVRMDSKDHFIMHGIIGTAGGKIGGRRVVELKVGVHAFSKERRKEVTTAAGKIGGVASKTSGASYKNYEIGRQNLSKKMKDPEWNSQFRDLQRAGWAAKQPKYNEGMINFIFNLARSESKNGLLAALNGNQELKELFYAINSETPRHVRTDYSKFFISDVRRLIKLNGFSTFTEMKEASLNINHKIAKIEYLNEKIDVGCITVDKNEKFHNYHTFALDAGIYSENSMLEDFFLPRSAGSGRGTEITTLPGGDGMDQTDHLKFFRKNLYMCLNVPVSRLDAESAYAFGKPSESVSREEIKFQRYISALRKKFSQLFLDILKVQLILTRVIEEGDWKYLREKLSVDFLQDNYFTELKELEIMKERLDMVDKLQPHIGKYYSDTYIRKNVLRQSDDEIVRMAAEIEAEKGTVKVSDVVDTNVSTETTPEGLKKDESELQDINDTTIDTDGTDEAPVEEVPSEDGNEEEQPPLKEEETDVINTTASLAAKQIDRQEEPTYH